MSAEQDRPCEDDHVLADPGQKYGTCTKCGWFVNQWADQDEEGP
ncbi:hypothetical protein [Nocardiopsis sp. FR26]|nr:hypothetical protein [Nocardiopsis sp. FR26]